MDGRWGNVTVGERGVKRKGNEARQKPLVQPENIPQVHFMGYDVLLKGKKVSDSCSKYRKVIGTLHKKTKSPPNLSFAPLSTIYIPMDTVT